MIQFTLYGELIAEPRRDQVRRETIRKSSAEAAERARDPHMRQLYLDSVEEYSDPKTRIGRDSTGVAYTWLELNAEGQRVEVTARGPLAEKAARLEPGDFVRIVGEVRGEQHLSLEARRIRK